MTNHIKKNTLSIFTLSILGITIVSNLFTPIQAFAGGLMAGDYVRVTNTGLLNVRNKDCKVIQTIKKNTVLVLDRPEAFTDVNPISIDCKIGDKTYTMVQVNLTLIDNLQENKYVSSEFITFVGRNNFDTRLPITNKSPVNLRDKNCKKIKSLKTGVIAEIPVSGTNMIHCKIGNIDYGLLSMIIDGVEGYSAIEYWNQ